MPFHLVTGRANAGKTGIIAHHIAVAVESGQPAVMLLPSQADVRRAREEFARKTPVGLSITTFDRWVEELWLLHGDGRRFVSALTREALVARVCEEAEDLEVAAASAKTRGFQKMVGRIAARLCGDPLTPSGAAERDIARLVAAYNAALADGGLVEPSHAATLLASRPPLLEGVIVANRFVDLSDSQERLLVSLGKDSHVMVGLTWEQGFPATEALTDLVDRLAAVAIHSVCETPAATDELGRVEARLYEGRAAESPAAAAGERMLELGIAAGAEAEVELIAERVEALVQGGVRPDRIAVVFRDPTSRAARLLSSLERRGVPAASDMAVPLGSTPLGKAFLSLLSVCTGRGGRADLYAFLASPFSATDLEVVVEADRRWRRLGIDDGAMLLARSHDFSEMTSRMIKTARRLSRQPLDAHTGRNWKQLADLLLQAGGSRTRLEEKSVDAAAHRAIVSSVQAVLEMQTGCLAPMEFAAALQDAAVSVSAGDRAGRLQVTDVGRMRSRRFDAVIIGGLTADEFSSEYREPLAAHYVRELGGRGGTDERLSERMLFYLLATRARHRLILVRRGTNEKGEGLRPSVFWEEVVDLYRPAEVEDVAVLPDGIPVTWMGVSRLASIVPASSSQRGEQRNTVRGTAMRSARVLHAALGEDPLGEMAATDVFSVTELETYLQCPYRWFYTRAVRPREIDQQLDARQAGSLAHEIMRVFYERFHAAGHERVTPQGLEDALKLLTDVADSVIESSALPDNLALADELAVRRARRWAEHVVRADARFLPDYHPIAHEERFGYGGEPAITVDGVQLRGSIDRVELGPAGVVVIDYKSGTAGVKSWQKFEADGLLQPAIYALVAAEKFERSPAAGVYRHMGTNAVRGFWRDDQGIEFEVSKGPDRLDEAGVEEVLDSARTRMHRAVEGIRSGIITPTPLMAEACSYCGARAFCPEVRS